MGIDRGRRHATAAYWFAREDGKTKVYQEYCKTDRTPASAAQEIIDFTPKEERRHIRNIFISHDAFAERTDPNTIALQMTAIFMRNGMAQPTKAPKNPIAGALLIYDMLQRCELLIDSSCHKLMECIPMVTRDEEEPRNTVKFEGDDPTKLSNTACKGIMRPWSRQSLRTI